MFDGGQRGTGQRLHGRLRQVGRPQDAIPLRHLKPGPALLGHRGHIGQLRQALQRAGGNAAQLAGAHELDHGGCAHGRGLQPAGQQVGQLRPRAPVGHMHDEGLGGHLEVFHGQVTRAAVAGGPVAQLTRAFLHVVHELAQVLHRQVGVHQVEAGHLGQQGHRLEVPVGVIGQAVEDVGVDCQRADVAQDEGVLVFRPRHFLHGHIARATGLVLHVHRLSQ